MKGTKMDFGNEDYEARQKQREAEEKAEMRKKVRKYLMIGIPIAAVVIGLITLLFASPIGYAEKDHIYLVYQDGPLDGRDYIKTVEAGGGLYWKGLFNDSYGYPLTQRNYIVSKKADEGDVKGADVFQVQASDGNTIEIQSSVYFQLPTDDPNFHELLRQFHEKIGYKTKAWTDDGWDKMLSEFVRQPMRGALQDITSRMTPVEAAGSRKMEIRDSINKDLQRRVDAVMGGHYINVYAFELISVYPGDQINDALQNVVRSQQGVLAAENDKQAALITAQGNIALSQSLTGQGGMAAVMQKAVDRGDVKFWIVPQGSNLALSAQP